MRAIKNQNKIVACEQKPLERKRISNTVFSTLKLEWKNFTTQTHSHFWSKTIFPNWLQKSWKCLQILKKTVPQYKSNSLNCKNHDVPNNSRYRFAAIKKTRDCKNCFNLRSRAINQHSPSKSTKPWQPQYSNAQIIAFRLQSKDYQISWKNFSKSPGSRSYKNPGNHTRSYMIPGNHTRSYMICMISW